MHQSILSEYLSFINRQIAFQEQLLECHIKAHSMFEVILGSDLSSHSQSTMHSYLWTLEDIIHHAQELNEALLDYAIERLILVDPSKSSPPGNSTLH